MAEQYHKMALANSTVVLARFLTAKDRVTLPPLALPYYRPNLLNLQGLVWVSEQKTKELHSRHPILAFSIVLGRQSSFHA